MDPRPSVHPAPPPLVSLASQLSEFSIRTDRHGRLPDLAATLLQNSGRAPSPPQLPSRQVAGGGGGGGGEGGVNPRPHYEEIFAWPLAPNTAPPLMDRRGQDFPRFFPAPVPVPAPKTAPRPDFQGELPLPSPAVVGAAYHKQVDVRGGAPPPPLRETGVPRAIPSGADNSCRFEELSPREAAAAQSVSSQSRQADTDFTRSTTFVSNDTRIYGDVVVVPSSAPTISGTYPPPTGSASSSDSSSSRPRGPDYVKMSVPVNLPVFPPSTPTRADVVQSQTVPRPRKPPKPVPAPRKRPPPVSPRKEGGGGGGGRNWAEAVAGGEEEKERNARCGPSAPRSPAVNTEHALSDNTAAAAFGKPRASPGFGPAVSAADSSSAGRAVHWGAGGDKGSSVTSSPNTDNNSAVLGVGDRGGDRRGGVRRMAGRGIQLAAGNATALAMSVAAAGNSPPRTSSKSTEENRADRNSQGSDSDYSECLSPKRTTTTTPTTRTTATTSAVPETNPSSAAESRLEEPGGRGRGEDATGCGDSAPHEGDPSSSSRRPSPPPAHHALPSPPGGAGAPPPPPGQQAGSQQAAASRQPPEPSRSQPAARLDAGQHQLAGSGQQQQQPQRLVTFHPHPPPPGHPSHSGGAPPTTRPGAPLHPAAHPQSPRQAQPHPASANKSDARRPPDPSCRGAALHVSPDDTAAMKKFSARKSERKDLEADGYGATTVQGTYRRIPESGTAAATRSTDDSDPSSSSSSSTRPRTPEVDYENSAAVRVSGCGQDQDKEDPYTLLSRVDGSLENSPVLPRRSLSDGEAPVGSGGEEDVVLRKKGPDSSASSTIKPQTSDQEPVYAKVRKKRPRVVSYENWTINALVSRPLDSAESSDEGEENDYDRVSFPASSSPASLKKFLDKGSSDSGLSEDIAGGETPPHSDRGPPTPLDPPTLPSNLQELRDLNTDDDDGAGDDERDDSGDSDKNGDNVSLTSDIIFIPGADAEGRGELQVPASPHLGTSSEEEAETTSNKSYDELDAVPQAGPEDPDEVKLQMRLLIVKGVLDSEKSYLSIMSLLMTYKRSLEASSKTSQPVISSEDIKSIFGNLSALYTIHQNFVEGLEAFVEKGDAHAEIGEIFKTLVVHMPRFGDYMENYQQAVATIQRCCQENVQFQEIAQKVTFSAAGKEITNLEDALFKPVQRVQRNTLVLHDLLKHTPDKHKDYHALQRALQLAQHNLESFGSNMQTTQQEERRRLVKSSFFVELVGGVRKLRCIFLFNDVIVCTKREAHRNKVSFDCKWFIPLPRLEHDTRFSYQDDQKHLHKEEIQELKRKIGQLKTELKAELKKEEDTRDKHWSLSGLAASRNVEKRKKKIQELEGQMILASPRLPFKLGMEGGKTYTLLMTTDYEREEWRETLTALCRRSFTSDGRDINAMYVQELVNSVRELPQVNKIGSVIMQKDEETLDGTLNVTVHKLNGLTDTTAAETYCCLEMDSYGHFFMKARTNICPATADPTWNEDFELELDGSQTLRILAYQTRPDPEGDLLLGRGAVELSKSWLTSNFQEKTISLNEVSLVISVRHTPADKTMRRTPSQQKSAVFGVKIATCTRREGKTVPTIVTTCLAEVEKRGLEEVGIYRVSGVSSEVQRLKKMFDKNARAAASVVAETDINAVTGVLKLYFRELPEPLFTEANYSKFVDAFYLQDQDAKERCMLDLLHNLPDANYYCIVTLAEHLLKVAQKEPVNKMSLHNVSTIFGPTLLAPASKGSSYSPADLIFKGAEDVMIQAGIINSILSILASGRSLRRSAPC